MFFVDIFVNFIYQPFFNILLFFYWGLGFLTQGHPDMGIAVILLTILIRILLLPLSLAGDKSEKERRAIASKIKELEVAFSHDPITFRQQKKKLIHGSKSVFIGEFVSLLVQVGISLMLYKIFTTGLEGADTHLIYSFMPDIPQPFNLVFLNRFDLAHTNFTLNLLQSILIFVLETLSIYTSPYPPEKGEVVRLQLILPIVSFFVFMFFPAGKKLFVITALAFSIVLVVFKFVKHRYEAYKLKKEEAEALAAAGAAQQPIVVEVK